jgi:hypothetical protein
MVIIERVFGIIEERDAYLLREIVSLFFLTFASALFGSWSFSWGSLFGSLSWSTSTAFGSWCTIFFFSRCSFLCWGSLLGWSFLFGRFCWSLCGLLIETEIFSKVKFHRIITIAESHLASTSLLFNNSFSVRHDYSYVSIRIQQEKLQRTVEREDESY